MRRWIVILFIVVVLLFLLPYVLIPNKIYLDQKIVLAVNAKAFSRTILEDSSWQKWWPGKTTPNSDSRWPNRFQYDGYNYQLIGKQLSSQAVMIESEKGKLLTEILFVPVQTDSISVSWQGVVYPSNLPWARVSHYFTAKQLESDWKKILQSLTEHYEKEENIYGLRVEKQLVKDPNLISTTTTSNNELTTEQVYELIEKLNSYANSHQANTTGSPMLNTTKMLGDNDSVYYRTQVAIPVNKELPSQGRISYKWMLPRGNILVTEIIGGPFTIQKAFQRMENYVADHNRVSPAIPFQSLVTDRRRESDTSKWVTKIYWPVM